jgi:adenine-specific DNA-methyltransferase
LDYTAARYRWLIDSALSSFDRSVRKGQFARKSAIERCILMTTDPGDLVLDPTCASGTTTYVAEQWGRGWITIDTSRVALALALARIMGARYPWYLLTDSPEGKRKEAEITRYGPTDTRTRGDIRQGFVYDRVPHFTLKSIANNAEIDVIWERWQEKVINHLGDEAMKVFRI